MSQLKTKAFGYKSIELLDKVKIMKNQIGIKRNKRIEILAVDIKYRLKRVSN